MFSNNELLVDQEKLLFSHHLGFLHNTVSSSILLCYWPSHHKALVVKIRLGTGEGWPKISDTHHSNLWKRQFVMFCFFLVKLIVISYLRCLKKLCCKWSLTWNISYQLFSVFDHFGKKNSKTLEELNTVK